MTLLGHQFTKKRKISNLFGIYRKLTYLIVQIVNNRVSKKITKQKMDNILEACREGDLQKVIKQLKRGISNIEYQEDEGYTPLTIASKDGRLDIVKCLVEHGANVEGRDYYGYTPLMYASWGDHLDIAKYLLEEKGADIGAKDDEGNTSLIYASRCIEILDNADMIKYLLSQGANIEDKNDFEQNSLILASAFCQIVIVKCLVENGANLECKNHDGNTFLHYFDKDQNKEMEKFVEKVFHNRALTMSKSMSKSNKKIYHFTQQEMDDVLERVLTQVGQQVKKNWLKDEKGRRRRKRRKEEEVQEN